MTTNTFTSLLEEVRDAKTRKMNWVELGEVVNKLSKSPEFKQRYTNKEAFWEELFIVTGYTRNILQRISSTVRNLEEHEKAERDLLMSELNVKHWKPGYVAECMHYFTKAEMYLRIFKHDKAAGIMLLKRMQFEKVGMQELKAIWHRILNQRPELKSPGFKVAGQTKREMVGRISTLEKQKSVIYGDDEDQVSIYFDHFDFKYVSIDAVSMAHGEAGRIYNLDGFVYLNTGVPLTKGALREFLASIDYQSSFFRHLWLYDMNIFSWPIDRIQTALDELGMSQIGIVEFILDEGPLRIVRRPSDEIKPIRYNSIINEVVRHGIKDYGIA